jgi:hypothetical protein
MGGIARKASAVELAAVTGKYKPLNGTETLGETAGFANEPFEGMTEFTIHAFNPIGFQAWGYRSTLCKWQRDRCSTKRLAESRLARFAGSVPTPQANSSCARQT